MAFAHSINAAGERHDLVAHLRAVAETASRFATGLNARELAYYAGLWHDLGKFHPSFQDYLLRCEERPGARSHGPDHKAAGAQLASSRLPYLGLVLRGHHGGLGSPSLFTAWLAEKGALPAPAEALALARAAIHDLEPSAPLPVPVHVRADPMAAEMFLRLVFSALVDADFLDTEGHFDSQRSQARSSAIDLQTLWQRLEASQDALIGGAAASPVNAMRQEIYGHCLAAAEHETGFFRLTVPTGGGKTRSGLAFALLHALYKDLDRVVVAVPFTSITEQTAATYREIFGDGAAGAVLEHHSLAEWDEDDEGDFHGGPVWDRLAAENWDAPVVVTTTVQLFQSLFSNRTSQTRKLHRLAHSVIILDEAQSLPARLLTPILDGLRQLVDHYGATVVISTATQPAFDAIPAFAAVPAIEIVPSPERYFEALKRVAYEWQTQEAWSWERTVGQLREQPRALAVLNTKKQAMQLLEALGCETAPIGPGWREDWPARLHRALSDSKALHLSTLLCGAHRRDVLEEVKHRLDSRETCHLVSTQVIEAGVDLDFPFVLRALAPLDSIIQAAGRCNREGSLPSGRVVVFEPEGGAMPQGVYRAGADIAASMLRAGPLDPDSPETSRRYFRSLFDLVDTDAERIQPLRRGFEYAKVAQMFRMIDDETYSVVVTSYGDASTLRRLQAELDQLSRGVGRARELRRRLQPYVVGLKWRQAQRLLRDGLIQELRPGYGIWQGGYDAVRGIILGDAEPDAFVF